MALVDRTAYLRLPSRVSARELAEAFTPTVQETSWACAKVAGPVTRLALLVMLKCYQRLGYFPRLERVPPEVVEHVRVRAVELPGKRADPLGWQPDRMVRRCRELVREHAGAVRDPERVNGGFCRLVAGRLDAAGRARLLELLVVDPASRQSALPKLTRPAPRATVSRLKQHVAWLAWLDGLGATQDWLAGLPPAKISHFAGEAAVLDAGELAGVGEDKRLTLLACLVHTARTRAWG